MKHVSLTLNLTLKNNELQLLMDFIKNLTSSENVVEKEINYPTLTDKQIVERVGITNKEIKQGKFMSQDDLIKEAENW